MEPEVGCYCTSLQHFAESGNARLKDTHTVTRQKPCMLCQATFLMSHGLPASWEDPLTHSARLSFAPCCLHAPVVLPSIAPNCTAHPSHCRSDGTALGASRLPAHLGAAYQHYTGTSLCLVLFCIGNCIVFKCLIFAAHVRIGCI
jgi:hypothetical protein